MQILELKTLLKTEGKDVNKIVWRLVHLTEVIIEHLPTCSLMTCLCTV